MVAAVSWPRSGYAGPWYAPDAETRRQNPVAMSAASVAKGKTLFKSHCISCHGSQARGLEAARARLDTDTVNLVAGLKVQTSGAYHWKIKNGRKRMPGYQQVLSDQDIWHIINYISQLD